MDVDLFRHWIPDLRQTKNKNAYVSKQCPFCDPTPSSKSFRVNTKLKVWKCYQCGKSGKDFNKFVHYLKRMGRQPIGISIEVYYGCLTEYESYAPF